MENTPEFYQFLASMGVGGVLAGFAIWMLNKAWKDHSEVIKSMSAQHAEVIKGYHEIEKGRADMMLSALIGNTTQTVSNLRLSRIASFHPYFLASARASFFVKKDFKTPSFIGSLSADTRLSVIIFFILFRPSFYSLFPSTFFPVLPCRLGLSGRL